MQNLKETINIIFIVFLTILFISLPDHVFAASINLSGGSPNTILDPNQEYQVNVSLNIDSAEGTVYYLRGVFYQSGSSNYCGFTWNGFSWYNGPYTTNNGWKSLLKITVASSSAVASLKAKIDSGDSGCKNSGNYNFKIQRYTEGGSATFDQQSEQSVTINYPTPTPTQTPVPTSVSTQSPSNTPVPTNTPILQNSPTPTVVSPTVKKATITTYVYDPNDDSNMPTRKADTTGDVLGDLSAPSLTSDPVLVDNATSKQKRVWIPLLIILIAGGTGLIGASVVMSARKTRRRHQY